MSAKYNREITRRVLRNCIQNVRSLEPRGLRLSGQENDQGECE